MKFRLEFEGAVAGIKASETGRHAFILYGLIRWLQPKTVVEVGSWLGHCTAWMARALQENGEGHLYSIDKFERGDTSPSILHAHLRYVGVDDFVTTIHGDSMEVAWPEHVDFAFIDGNHTWEHCQADIVRASDAGASCIVVHDTTGWWGPREFVDVFRKLNGQRWDILEVTFDSGLAILMRNPTDGKPAVQFSEQTYPRGYGGAQ